MDFMTRPCASLGQPVPPSERASPVCRVSRVNRYDSPPRWIRSSSSTWQPRRSGRPRRYATAGPVKRTLPLPRWVMPSGSASAASQVAWARCTSAVYVASEAGSLFQGEQDVPVAGVIEDGAHGLLDTQQACVHLVVGEDAAGTGSGVREPGPRTRRDDVTDRIATGEPVVHAYVHDLRGIAPLACEEEPPLFQQSRERPVDDSHVRIPSSEGRRPLPPPTAAARHSAPALRYFPAVEPRGFDGHLQTMTAHAAMPMKF